MKIYVAEEAGFCFGVKRALEIIDRLHEKGHELQIYGQLIHNPTVLDDLNARGIHRIDSLDQAEPGKTLVIRTHGIPRETEEQLKLRKINYVDATCPLVKKLQHKVETLSRRYSRLVIVGDENHPEIIAARSYAPGAQVIGSEEQARGLEIKPGDTVGVVGQTTLEPAFFEKIVSIMEGKTTGLHVHNTICGATKTRQQAIAKLASNVDLVIVVGGKNSSNTKKLYNIARKQNKNTLHVEKSSDLYQLKALAPAEVANYRSVGITAGASTPPGEIENVKTFFSNVKTTTVKEMYHG
jgi:4-hydroxy-3-methylbut-2-enyl diphosphate reductase